MKSEQTMTELKKAITAIASDGLAGAAFGGIAGMVIMSVRCNPRALRPLAQYGGRCARDCSASLAAWSATEHLMKGVRGKEDDLASNMVSASSGGFAYSFVSQGFKPAHALSWAASYAVAGAAVFKVKETIRARSEHSTSTKGKAFDT